MNLQNFCQRGGLAVLVLGAAAYAGLATLRSPPALAPPPVPVPAPAMAVAAPASPAIALPVAAPVAAPVPVAVDAPVQATLVTKCPIPAAAPAPPRPVRHVSEPRPHRWSRANIVHAGARGERGRPTARAARAEAAPPVNADPVHDRRQAVRYAARGRSDRRVD